MHYLSGHTRHQLHMVLLLLAVFNLVIGCGEQEPTADAEQSTTTSDTAADVSDHSGWPDVVRVGLVPTEGGADTRERFASFRDHLHNHMNVPIELVSASSYQGVITAMANNQLEFVWLGPKSYIEAADRANAEALLIELNMQKQPGYHGVFIVPADSPIKSLHDARGKRFAFTDPNSTSGCLVPSTVLFDELGEPAESFFGEVFFSGAHGTSILQVANNEIDIAATNDLDLAKLVQKGSIQPDDIRVIYTSDLIPGSPLAARRDVPKSLKLAFIEAVLKLNDKPAVLEQLQNGGYERVSDEEYDIIRAMKQYLASRNQDKSS